MGYNRVLVKRCGQKARLECILHEFSRFHGHEMTSVGNKARPVLGHCLFQLITDVDNDDKTYFKM